MKITGGWLWVSFEFKDGRWLAPFNLLPPSLWGFCFERSWYDGPITELRLGFFNISWSL